MRKLLFQSKLGIYQSDSYKNRQRDRTDEKILHEIETVCENLQKILTDVEKNKWLSERTRVLRYEDLARVRKNGYKMHILSQIRKSVPWVSQISRFLISRANRERLRDHRSLWKLLFRFFSCESTCDLTKYILWHNI